MKRNFILFVSVILALSFVVSCSGSEESLPCLTVMDCPDSSFSCIDERCVLNDVANETTDSDKQGGNSSSTGENENNSGSGDNNSDGNNSENGNDDEGGLPDPVTNDEDGNSGPSNDDSSETSDADGVEENDGETDDNGNESDNDNENNDENGVISDDDNENGDDDIEESPLGQVTDCEKDEDCASNINNRRCDPSLKQCVICVDNGDCDTALGQNCDLSTHECVSNATCAAVIAKLPYGGKYDWEDGTTQGFSTNAYWNIVSSTLLPDEKEPVLTHGGSYSFGNYSGYTEKMDHTSVLESVTDLSSCLQCTLKAHFYARGQVENDSTSRDFIHPTCNGVGDMNAKNATVNTQSWDPESPWEAARFDNGDGFWVKYNSYSEQKWTELDWTIPEACKTEKFVFGLRFSSSQYINKKGLVVDNLTIAPAATGHEPNGEFESAVNGYIKGWACDLDLITKNVLVKVEYYKNQDDSAVVAERWVYADKEIASDPDSPLATQCNATYDHGFAVPLDEDLKVLLGEDGTHKAVVYAVDIPSAENLCGGTYTKLGEKEFEFTNSEPKK